MSDPLLLQLLLQLFLILINAIFACAEIALLSVNENKLEKKAEAGSKNARRLLALKAQPEKFLATIQVGITLAGFMGSAFAAENFSGRLAKYFLDKNIPLPISTIKTGSLIVITLLLSFFTMVLGEIVPKRIAMKKAEKMAHFMSFFLWLISKIFSPVVWLLTSATNGILYLLNINPKEVDAPVTEEEIRLLVDAGSLHGAIEESEKNIIQNVFEFDDRRVSQIMTHRKETVILWVKDESEVWDNAITQTRHSFYPVCGKTFDDIIGVLSTRDYLLSQDKSREAIMKLAVHPPVYIPESVKADVLFSKMKKLHIYFAIVLDEYGGLAGVVSIIDLLESIVGDLGFNSDL